jgi:uncharacterized membrane protein YhdT
MLHLTGRCLATTAVYRLAGSKGFLLNEVITCLLLAVYHRVLLCWLHIEQIFHDIYFLKFLSPLLPKIATISKKISVMSQAPAQTRSP